MYNNTTVMDVELQNGWNLIKYEIAETFISQTGKTYASKTRVSTLAHPPEDVQRVVISY